MKTNRMNTKVICYTILIVLLIAIVAIAMAWLWSVDNSNGRNACVIEKGVSYRYFKRITVLGQTIGYTLTTVAKKDW